MSQVAVSPNQSMAAGTIYGGALPGQPPTEVVMVDLQDGTVRSAALEGWNDDGEVAWLDDGQLVYLPGGADDSTARVYDSEMNQVASFDGWYTAEVTVVGDTAYGIGWGDLFAAELPNGPAHVLERLEGVTTYAMAYVPRGREVRPSPRPAATPSPARLERAGASERGRPGARWPVTGLLLAVVVGGFGSILLVRRVRRRT
jgi:hypothetical protein